jgi:hypothetical protein
MTLELRLAEIGTGLAPRLLPIVRHHLVDVGVGIIPSHSMVLSVENHTRPLILFDS